MGGLVTPPVTKAQMQAAILTMVGDGAPARILFTLIGANMNVDTDQSFTKIGTFSSYIITTNAIRITNASISLTTAVGGIYSAGSKGGDALLAASQVYSGMTGPTLGSNLGPSTLGNAVRTETPILSLSTPQGATATLDFRIYGIPLS